MTAPSSADSINRFLFGFSESSITRRRDDPLARKRAGTYRGIPQLEDPKPRLLRDSEIGLDLSFNCLVELSCE